MMNYARENLKPEMLVACSDQSGEPVHQVCAFRLNSDDAAGSWVQLLTAGQLVAKDGRGVFRTGNREGLEQIIARSKAHVGDVAMVIDYEHQTIHSEKNGMSAPAAGWVEELEARETGIWALVRWTEKAKAAIRADEYRYLSPVFTTDKDRNVVKVVHAALTNYPAADLEQVAAKQIQTEEGTPMEKILAALGLEKGASEADAVTRIEAFKSMITKSAASVGLKEDAKPDEVSEAVVALKTDFDGLVKASGADDGADAKTAGERIEALKVAASSKDGKPDPAKYVPVEDVVKLQEDLNAFKSEVQDDKASETVNKAIEDGKLAPALKEWGLQMCKANPAEFEKFTSNAPVLTARQLTGAKPGEGAKTLSDEELQVCKQMGLTEEQFLKTKEELAAD